MYCNEVLLLFSITPLHSDAFIKPWQELKISIKADIGGSCNGKYSWTPIFTSSPMWNLWPRQYSFDGPSRVDDSELPSTNNCTNCCVAFHRHAEGSQPATAHPLGHSSNTWDIAISTTKRKQKRLFMNRHEHKGPTSTVMEFLHLMPSWGKCINVNGECVEK